MVVQQHSTTNSLAVYCAQSSKTDT